MQMPTLQNVRIRSTRDAHQIFLGVARNVLPLITRRLDAEERRAIVPGNVYVWEERGSNSEATGLGMERWTDGMGWGPSRVRDEFLFYHQKEDVNEENPSTPWALMISMYPSPRSRSMNELERLIKQTYSVHVSLPADRARGVARKWHITAYFSQEKLDSLATVDTIRGVGDIPVPEGLFRSGRAGKARGRESVSTRVSGNSNYATGTGSSHAPHALDPPSFSAFYSKPPDAAIQYLYPTPGSYLPSQAQIMSTKVAAGDRQRSSNTPTAVGSSIARSRYRNQSPSVSPTPSDHSQKDSLTHSDSSSPAPSSAPLGSQLVPLEYLRNVSTPPRYPADEQLLRRFSTHSVSSAASPRYDQTSRPSTPGQSPPTPSGQPAARHAKNRHETAMGARSC